MKRILFVLVALFSVIAISACAGNNVEQNDDTDGDQNTENPMEQDENENEDEAHSNDEDMNHSSSGEVPDELEAAENPTYEVGSKAIIETDHMDGMKGAEATIVGAYSTNVYAVSYVPTTGGEEVTNHKWVIQEELVNAGDDLLEPGTEVTLDADHMEGMQGAEATIDTGEQTTVYMIDYTSTTDGEKVTNHKWVTEDELSPSKED